MPVRVAVGPGARSGMCVAEESGVIVAMGGHSSGHLLRGLVMGDKRGVYHRRGMVGWGGLVVG